MALNPVYASHTSRKLPIAFGYVQGSGDSVLHTIASDNSRYAICLNGEGEWDGVEMLAPTSDSHMENGTKLLTTWAAGLPAVFHFYRGSWATIGLGNAGTCTGSSQSVDEWFAQFPTVTPPQKFSGICYSSHYIPGSASAAFGFHVQGTATSDITNVGIWRTTRCRTFDSEGNVLSYGFTCNPAWIIVEAILRYKIKPQQPPIAGLTPAEKACFNWPSIVAFAARNDYILPNGNPRFFFSGVFAADAALTNIVETILRVSRAYQRTTNGQLCLIGDDPRDPVFTMSLKHVVPGSVKLGKKDLSRSPNQFVPRYREIDMVAICEVVSAVNSTMEGGAVPVCKIATTSLSPFLARDVVTYGGALDPSFDGSYDVVEPQDGGAPAAYIPGMTYGGIYPGSSASTTGGYLGCNDARFGEFAPTGVQHRSHQRRIAMQAPGLAVQPVVVPVYYDMGNSTFDQTNRVMQFECISQLGPDPVVYGGVSGRTPVHGTPVSGGTANTGVTLASPVGGAAVAQWIGPIAGTLSAYLDQVDDAGNYLKDVERGDVITLDDWLTPEFAGQYVVKNITVNGPSDGERATVDFELASYYPEAYTDVSADSSSFYQTVPGQGFKLSGFTPIVNPAWTLQATPVGVLSSGDWTITIANLVMQIGGIAGTTAYPGFSVASIPTATVGILYIDDPSLGLGVGATYGWQAGTTLATQPAGRYIVLIGSFTNIIPLEVTPGDPSVLFEPA